MKDYIEAEVKEDCVIFSLNPQVKHKPRREIRQDLQSYIADLKSMEEHEEDVRVIELDELYCQYAQLLIDYIDAEKDLPERKSYSLNM